MAKIVLNDITPRYFFESVNLFRNFNYSIKYKRNSLVVSFDTDIDIFNKIEYLEMFLRELENCSVPVDLETFIKNYKRIY